MKTLVLGGIKSGKSRLAEKLAIDSSMSVVYVATATGDDGEMQKRIAHHKTTRPQHWQVVEEPLQLAEAIVDHSAADTCVLVDCLTLWLTNVLLSKSCSTMEQRRSELVHACQHAQGTVVMVSNETNMGIIPLGELTRQYCDEVGLLHQQLAAICDNVILTVAGLPHYLKGKP